MAKFHNVKDRLPRLLSGGLFVGIAICRYAKMKVRGSQQLPTRSPRLHLGAATEGHIYEQMPIGIHGNRWG